MQYWTVCEKCRRVSEAKREAERFEKAEKVTVWAGAVYWEGTGCNDGFFASMADLKDWIAYRDEEEDEEEKTRIPEYVWTCDNYPFCQLDTERIIENATESEAYEDWDYESIVGRAALESAIATFNEANKHHVAWHPNFKRAISL